MKRFFNDSDVVLFQGDSVTDCGRSREDLTDLGPGYPSHIANMYNYLFPDNAVTFVNRGVSGDRVRNLLNRYDEDILAIKPTFISILIGVNDTWRRYDRNDPISTELFTEQYEQLLRKIKSDFPSARIMLLAPFILHTLPDRIAWHEDIDPKIIAVYELAKKYADYLVPLDNLFDKGVSEGGFSMAELTADGVHPSQTGHNLIAVEYLKTLGIL